MTGQKQGWAIWVTGLPGCGKSTLARLVAETLAVRGVRAELLSMDARRKTYFPHPTYSDQERAKAYELLADEAVTLTRQGRNVLIDATAPAKNMRRRARRAIPRFAEIHLGCDAEAAMQREAARPEGQVMAGLYAKALERKRSGREFPGLGKVPGVDVPFEEDERAELVLDAHAAPKELCARVVELLTPWLGD